MKHVQKKPEEDRDAEFQRPLLNLLDKETFMHFLREVDKYFAPDQKSDILDYRKIKTFESFLREINMYHSLKFVRNIHDLRRVYASYCCFQE